MIALETEICKLAYRILNTYIEDITEVYGDQIHIGLKKLLYIYKVNKEKNSEIAVCICNYKNNLILDMFLNEYNYYNAFLSIIECLEEREQLGMFFTDYCSNIVSKNEILEFNLYNINVNVLKL